MDDLIGKRIADFAIKASFEKDITNLEKILVAQGATIQRYHETEIHIRKPNYSTALILGSDPITCLAIIVMALWGTHGMLTPAAKVAFKEVNKRWGEITKAAKVSAKAEKIQTEEQLAMEF